MMQEENSNENPALKQIRSQVEAGFRQEQPRPEQQRQGKWATDSQPNVNKEEIQKILGELRNKMGEIDRIVDELKKKAAENSPAASERLLKEIKVPALDMLK